MKTQEMTKKTELIRDLIVEELRPDAVIMFGSWVWGQPTADSDLDLCIITEHSNPREQRRQLRKKFFGRQFPAIDLLMYSSSQFEEKLANNDFFIKKIATEGKTIYAKS